MVRLVDERPSSQPSGQWHTSRYLAQKAQLQRSSRHQHVQLGGTPDDESVEIEGHRPRNAGPRNLVLDTDPVSGMPALFVCTTLVQHVFVSYSVRVAVVGVAAVFSVFISRRSDVCRMVSHRGVTSLQWGEPRRKPFQVARERTRALTIQT